MNNGTLVNIAVAPGILPRLHAYAEAFEAHFPPLLSLFPQDPAGATTLFPSPFPPLFPFRADSDRGLGILLLAAALHRPAARWSGETGASCAEGTERSDTTAQRHAGGSGKARGFGGDAAGVVAGVYRAYGTDVFRLNRMPFEPLKARVDVLAAHWEEAERARIPGILRSVCDFFYRVGPLRAWMAEADWEQRVGEIAQEIYWMGARSPSRTKARLFFWLACQIPGFGGSDAMRPRAECFAWPVGEGHMRLLFDILKPPRATVSALRSAGKRGEAFADLARRVFPEEPWRLYVPFDAFLAPDGHDGPLSTFRCRTVQGGCRPCALSSVCPAAPGFLPREA